MIAQPAAKQKRQQKILIFTAAGLSASAEGADFFVCFPILGKDYR